MNHVNYVADYDRIQRFAAMLSEWVYLAGDAPGHRRFENEDRGTQGALAVIDGQAYLVFRGTEISWTREMFRDLWSDVGVAQIPFFGCEGKVHAGFSAAMRSVIWHIQDVAMHHQNIILCGHSLGGAIATLAAAWMIQEEIKPLRLVTFGSPAVGDKAFAKWLDASLPDHERYTQYLDIVPHLPPSWRWSQCGKHNNVGNGMHSIAGYVRAISPNQRKYID